ncbi:hypothetical protein F8M41_021509 [Gigaspora margarita]|uniref:Uncharacterized protein n=1 Tax=Gigaspora margarita TaxID=4874 RepID=A0A8H4AGN6_GIGMA|nr:hypothetical protein F8M41_021509 [Gigaspora margarita]
MNNFERTFQGGYCYKPDKVNNNDSFSYSDLKYKNNNGAYEGVRIDNLEHNYINKYNFKKLLIQDIEEESEKIFLSNKKNKNSNKANNVNKTNKSNEIIDNIKRFISRKKLPS